MRKHCLYCKKITRHKYKYIGREDSNNSTGAFGCLLIILTGGLWLIIELFFLDGDTKLYDRSCSKCGHTEYGVHKH